MPAPRGRSAMPGGAARSNKQQEAMERHQEVMHSFTNVLDYIANDLNIQPGGEEYVSGADEFSARSDAAPPPDPERSTRNPDGIHDVITIAEDPYFLGLTLTPWQRIILKLFYGGSAGNQHLALDDTRMETGCGDGKVGCVWAKNRKSEENYVRRIRALRESNRQGFIPLPLMNSENSPCIGCTRFDPLMREESLEYRIENAKDDDAADMSRRALASELTDRYETERDLFNRDLPHESPFDVRKQVQTKSIDRRSTFDELVMVLGRRSGKSFMTAVICSYEVYRLLKMGHPQLRYPILPFGEMTILNVAKSESQAKNALFNQIKALVFTSPYFAAQIGKDKELEIHFLTPADREENARREKSGQPALLGTVKLQSGHSNAGTLVGLACPIVVLDEVAEYGDARELYEKLAPMVSTFGDGKIICISNPTGPTGLFYDLYREGLKNKRSLVFQLPSWCSNPNIPSSELESLKYKLGTNYDIYIGAMFGDGGENPFLPRQYVDAAFKERSHKTRSEYGQAHINYFAHLDPSKNSDYYTLAVVHTEPTGEIDEQRRPVQKVIVDHIHVWKPDGKFAIDPRLVDDYIIKLSQRFRLAQLSYDQWNSVESIMRLTAAGLPHRLKTFNKQYNDEIYEQAYTLFITERISFYGCDSVQTVTKGLPGRQTQVQENIEDASLCKRQWTLLQRVWKGEHYKIEAMEGEHDDICDAVAAAAYEALKTKVVGALPRPRTTYAGWRR